MRFLQASVCLLGLAFAFRAEGQPARSETAAAAPIDHGAAAITLAEGESRVRRPLGGAAIADRRFLIRAQIRADAPGVPVLLELGYETMAGARRVLTVFEYVRTLRAWTPYMEDIVAPADAKRFTHMTLARGPGEGAVQIRGLALVPDTVRFDASPRPFDCAPMRHGPQEYGPTRAVGEGRVEMIYPASVTALSPDVPLPIVFHFRQSLAPGSPIRLVFDFPSEVQPVFFWMGERHNATEFPGREVDIGGQSYSRCVFPAQAYPSWRARLFAKTDLPAGRDARLGYHVEWEGGRQARRWLRITSLNIPAGAPMQRFTVAMSVIGPWGLSPKSGYADLMRRVGLNAVEVWDINANPGFRRPVLEYFRRHGLKILGQMSPGHAAGFARHMLKNDDMMPHGIDGKPLRNDDGTWGGGACPSYRGEHYRKQLEALRPFATMYGIDSVSFDEEFWGPGLKLCFCGRCKRLFRERLRQEHPALASLSLEEIARAPEGRPEAYGVWMEFKAALVTEWYRDYRRVFEEEWGKRDPGRPLRLWATCQTARCPVDVEYKYIMRDNATRLREGLIQGLLPMPYLYEPAYGGSVRKIGLDLMALQKRWGERCGGRPALLPYLLVGGSGMCFLFPQTGLKYQMLEAFTTGAVQGCILWNHYGMDGRHWQQLGEALHTLAKVEHILQDGAVRELACRPTTAAARAVVAPGAAAILVTEYGVDSVDVHVSWTAETASVVEDVRTGEELARPAPGAAGFSVRIDTERAILLRVRPAE